MKCSGRAVVVSTLLLAAAILLPAASSQAARGDRVTPSLEEAREHMRAKRWDRAAEAFEAITIREPSNGGAWLGLGRARQALEEYDAAVAAYEKAVELAAAPPTPQYNLACVHALRGDTDQAFAWLGRALDAGFRAVAALESDEDLASLRDDPRFRQVVEKADNAAHPCRHDEVNRQFDFWVGDWEVRAPQGQVAGTNSIQKLLDGCLLLENWTGARGSTGKSMNYYNPATGKWTQIWVDSGGDIISYEGVFRDGAMRFEGAHIERQRRTTVRSRMSFTPLPNGHVRQLIEESRDGGATWSVWFDGDYAPRN